jgi:flavin reductase (DIM6/NTAB) family NADH-FMN oxidoreductase RutF
VLSTDKALSTCCGQTAQAIRFGGLDCKLGATGCRGSRAVSALGAVRDEIDAGDHIVYIALVEAAEFESERAPLIYFRGAYKSLGPI